MYLSKEFEIEGDEDTWTVEVEAYVYWANYGEDADGRRGKRILEVEKTEIVGISGPDLDDEGKLWLASQVAKKSGEFEWETLMN